MNTKTRSRTKNPPRVKIKRPESQSKPLKGVRFSISIAMLGALSLFNLALTAVVLAVLIISHVQPSWLSFPTGGNESASAVLPDPNSLIMETVKSVGADDGGAGEGGQWIDDAETKKAEDAAARDGE